MESFMASWQFENFSTAELSPPSSPISPSSPLFYDGSSPSPSASVKGSLATTTGGALEQQSQKPGSNVVLSSRAQAATNMLNELERMHFAEQQTGFGMSQNEESVDLNMDLFEELRDIEFTPPISFAEEKMEVPSVPVTVVTDIIPHPAPDTARFTAEFKSIMESLHNARKISIESGNISPTINNYIGENSFGDLFHAAGIPNTTLVGDECLVPVELVGRPSATGSIGEEEASSMDLDGIIISDDLKLINESELFSELSAELATDENSSSGIIMGNATLVNGQLPYWAKDMMIPVDELDTQMSRNVDTLDALLKGDVSTAKNVIASGYSSPVQMPQAFSPVSVYSSEGEDSILDDDCIELEQAEIIEEPVVEEVKKTTPRRGRKPAKSNKSSLVYIKDKSLRKKEQNKTAATRYRQKKKEELASTLAVEEVLQATHEELEEQKTKLGSEIRVIRSLLRDMLAARKQRASPAASSITASSLVQARRVRIAKNRK